jgi:large subunit ribosomal protein L25
MEETVFVSSPRILGRSSSRQLRRQGLLPLNIYGHNQANQHVAVDYKAFEKFVLAGHRILALEIGGRKEHGVVKELQWDNLSALIIHADIARVDLTEKIVLSVQIITQGVAKGQTVGGTLDIALKDVRVEGPATAIPESIVVRVADLEINQSVRIRDLQLPEGCRFMHEPDVVVLAVHEKRIAAEAPVVEGPAEPELIAKKPAEEEVVEEEKDKGKKKTP